MDARAAAIAEGTAAEQVWLLEHPPLYTAGKRADPADLTDPGRFPVYPTGRGGQYTYHGPGQRVVYLMLDLRTRGRDVRAYEAALERRPSSGPAKGAMGAVAFGCGDRTAGRTRLRRLALRCGAG